MASALENLRSKYDGGILKEFVGDITQVLEDADIGTEDDSEDELDDSSTTRSRLREIADDEGVEYDGRNTKAELVDAIRAGREAQ